MAVRQCFICGFQLQPGLSRFGPYIFRAPPSVQRPDEFICSIHFDERCLTSVNNVWYLRKDSIPTLHLLNLISKEGFDPPVNKPGSNISNNQMEQNENEHNTSNLLSSSSELDEYTAMPKLSIAAEESVHPQNLNSRMRTLKFAKEKWSYRNETSSSSGNDSPPPLSPLFNEKNTSLSLDQKNEKDAVAIGHNRRLHLQVSAPSGLRRSSRLKSQIRKSFRPKTRPHRYCTSAGEFPCLNSKRTKEAKPSITRSKKPQSNNHNVENEIPKSYEADDIDGFLFLSFATATDLDKFCTEQLSGSSSSTVLPQTEKTVDCPSGSVVHVGVNVTESDKPHFEKLSSSHEETVGSVTDNIKKPIIIRKKSRMFPKFPVNIRMKIDTLERLKIQNRILRRKLDKALKELSERKLDQVNDPVQHLRSPGTSKAAEI